MIKLETILSLFLWSVVSHSPSSASHSSSTASLSPKFSSSSLHVGSRRNRSFAVPYNALHVRGGSTTESSNANKDLNNDLNNELKWRMQQQQLLQLRSTFFSEALAARGIPLTTMLEVSTLDGDKPPEEVDWDCVMSTEEDPKSCLYSFDAQPNTKVLAPKSTTQYISLTALNRLRRTDPTKVEPMWHSQYSILKSWFGEESSFSLMQHVGIKGFFVSTVLLDWGNGLFLKGLVLSALWILWASFLSPIVEYAGNRFLVSGLFWSFYGNWAKIAHAAFPLKLLMAQMGWKFAVGKLDALTNYIREYIVEYECRILEESIPLTVGEEEEESDDEFGLDEQVQDLSDSEDDS